MIGIDIGKEIFHLVGFGVDGEIAFRKKIKRLALTGTFKKIRPCIIGMEACLSAHFASRTLRALVHAPRIIPAIYVKPFVKGQKNDYNDAEAIAEAALRPNLRVVREKMLDELDLQAYHRIRSRLVSRRTATFNQIRAFLIEQGIAVRSGARALRNSLFSILKERADEISPRIDKTQRSASGANGVPMRDPVAGCAQHTVERAANVHKFVARIRNDCFRDKRIDHRIGDSGDIA